MLMFAFGVVVGLVLCGYTSWCAIQAEWSKRRDVEKRLKYLERNLCCGEGYFGCTGGPQCPWDHK